MNRNVTMHAAQDDDLPPIWNIILCAKEYLKNNGSSQWQDGYPSIEKIEEDIKSHQAYTLKENGIIIAYTCVKFGKEPAYYGIKGKWLSKQDYCVIHRMAIAKEARKRSLALFFIEKIEELCTKKGCFSIKVDTNYDNKAMLKTLQRKNFSYCGEVNYEHYSRQAFEKVL